MKRFIKYMIAITLVFQIQITYASGTCPDFAGTLILHTAWVSPKFTKCEFASVSQKDDGSKEISFKVNGESRISKLSDKEIWVTGIVVVDEHWKIKSVKWGSYKAMVPPGITTKILGKKLIE